MFAEKNRSRLCLLITFALSACAAGGSGSNGSGLKSADKKDSESAEEEVEPVFGDDEEGADDCGSVDDNSTSEYCIVDCEDYYAVGDLVFEDENYQCFCQGTGSDGTQQAIDCVMRYPDPGDEDGEPSLPDLGDCTLDETGEPDVDNPACFPEPTPDSCLLEDGTEIVSYPSTEIDHRTCWCEFNEEGEFHGECMDGDSEGCLIDGEYVPAGTVISEDDLERCTCLGIGQGFGPVDCEYIGPISEEG